MIGVLLNRRIWTLTWLTLLSCVMRPLDPICKLRNRSLIQYSWLQSYCWACANWLDMFRILLWSYQRRETKMHGKSSKTYQSIVINLHNFNLQNAISATTNTKEKQHQIELLSTETETCHITCAYDSNTGSLYKTNICSSDVHL